MSTPNPPTPPYTDDVQWITAYLVIHMMSPTSYWYAYILWFAIGFVFLAFAILHWTGSRGGYLGAYWSKWAIRRRTWRGKRALDRARKYGTRAQPMSLPSNGQLLCIVALPVITIILGCVGPDYIAPQQSFFSPRALQRRAWDVTSFFMYQPQYTIPRAWWTAGGRAGILAFALTPLCVLFALKAPPFALFALPFTTQMHFDKLAWLHRWTGLLIWVVTAIHVALWSVQLATEKRMGTPDVAYKFAWQYEKFLYGWIAFIILTALIALSMHPLRKRHYEAFYALHILLVPMSLVMMALHHPPVWWWCWSALALWLGERLWRATWWLNINGFFGANSSPAVDAKFIPQPFPQDLESSSPRYPPTHSYPPVRSHIPQLSIASINDTYVPPPGYACAELVSGATVRLTYISPGLQPWAPGQHFLINIPSVSKLTSHPFTAASVCDEQAPTDAGRVIVFLVRAKSGWTKDLWDYVVHLLSSGHVHPPHEKPPGDSHLPNNGVLLKMYVDGPFGSSVRAQWRKHSTALIIVGGSGVSFGLSILEFICMCLAGRDGKYLGGHAGGWGKKGFRIRRVRFVWIVREYAHIHWCASILRRCMGMIPDPGLEVNIFVTSAAPSLPRQLPSLSTRRRLPDADPRTPATADPLIPPSPKFAEDARRSRRDSIDSIVSGYGSDTSHDSYIDTSPVTPVFGDEDHDNSEVGPYDNYTLDLTNFDGDNEVSLPGEDALNKRVQKTGKIRRAKSRKASMSAGRQPQRPKRLPSPSPTRKERHTRGDQSLTSVDGLLTPSWQRQPDHHEHRSGDPRADSRTSGFDDDDTSTLRPSSLSFTPIAQKHLSMQDQYSPTGNDSPVKENQPMTSQSPFLGERDDAAHAGAMLKLFVDPREMHDVSVVSEHARPGKPRLDKILADEVESARGSVVVACCGPTSLNAMVRKSIAAQIDPARIRRGDSRGFINLVSEDFEY
ncbi:hypothetical protein HGRIS_013027 [Hohenbuehelia grisea]|uniref:FAD-binding FR-type domain-containing protein n=1 Tax=Hohenbuehelia grisea TaxID=104357 RepID=A0ABR3IUG5_9AGAR